MASEVVKIIDPDNGDGTDYTSLDAWEDALGGTTSGNLPNDDEIAIAECRSSSGTDDTAPVHIAGWTTDATRFIKVTGKGTDGDFPSDGVFDGTKYLLALTNITIIDIDEDYVRIEHIQLQLTQTNADCYAILVGSATSEANQTRIIGCIIKGVCSGEDQCYGINILDVNADTLIWNCIVYDFVSSGSGYYGIRPYCNITNIYNTTVYNCYYGIREIGGTVNVYNCAVGNCTDDLNITNGTIDHCCSDDNDGTNSQTPSGSDWDNEFTTPGSDFTLESGGNCVGNGTDNPGSGLYSDDITGTARTSVWDISAFEYVGGGVKHNISGSIDASTSLTGSLAKKAALGGIVEASSSLAGSLNVKSNLAGSINAQSSLSGSLKSALYDWFEVSSSNIDSLCGEEASYTLDEALDGTDFWRHDAEETHWFILDLGDSYTITKVRGRSSSSYDPIDVDIYVSDSKEDWGDAVATNITTWQDTEEWQEVETTPKSGRYIKVEIISTEVASSIRWGNVIAPFVIFDVYGRMDKVPLSGTIEASSSFAGGLSKNKASLAGATAASSDLSADTLAIQSSLAGVIEAASGLSGSLDVTGAKPLAGSVGASSSLSGSLGVTKSLSSTVEENFITYTEVDPNSHITVTSSKVAWDDLANDESAWVYKDMGADYFNGDFKFRFEVEFSGIVEHPAVNFWALANEIAGFQTIDWNDGDLIAFQYNGVTSRFYLSLIENGENTTDTWTSPVASTTYYITVERDDDGGVNGTGRITAYIRTGSHAGELKDTLTVDCGVGEQNDFRYLYALQGYAEGVDPDSTVDGFTQNMEMAGTLLGRNIAGQSSFSGTLGISQQLAGSIDAVSSLSGLLGAKMPVAGSISSSSSLSGILNANKQLGGAIEASSSFSADVLKAIRYLSGAIDAVSTLAGQLSPIRGLAGTIAGSGDLSASVLTLKWALAGAIESTSDITGSMSAIGTKPLAGTLAAVSSLVGSLAIIKAKGITSPEVEQAPRIRNNNILQWQLELCKYIENHLKAHKQDIETLYDVKQTAS